MENQQLNALFDSMMSSRLQRSAAASRQPPDSLDDMANQLQFDRNQQQHSSSSSSSSSSHQNSGYDTQLTEQEWRGNQEPLLFFFTSIFYTVQYSTYTRSENNLDSSASSNICQCVRNIILFLLLFHLVRTYVDILSSSLSRGSCDCAICMLPINMAAVATEINCRFSSSSSSTSVLPYNYHNSGSNGSNTNKRIVVLSCSHLFHEFCIHNFEKFLGLAVSSRFCVLRTFYYCTYNI